MKQINLKNISKSFTDDLGNTKVVFTSLNLKIDEPKFYVIIGPNGCGKSTLLNIIANTVKPEHGEVHYGDDDTMPNIGYIWQDYRSSLLPWLNVGENITFPLKIKGVRKKERMKIARNMLSEANIGLKIDNKTYQLSGGQLQIVNILRNMVISPDILLLDEPFSALDQFNRWSLAFKFEKMLTKLKIPVIAISHDVDEAILMADDIILLNKTGSIEKVLKNDLPRPRSVEMLSSLEHNECRDEMIKFLFDQGAIKNGGIN